MNADNKRKVSKMIEQLQVYITEIESINEDIYTKLKSMSNRSIILGDKADRLEREMTCLDIARIELGDAINDLCQALE